MAWVYLVLAGLLEILMAIALKQSQGLSRLVPSVVMVMAMAASMGLLALAVRTLPIGIAYAIWTGIGAAGTAAVGAAWLGEQIGAVQVALILTIIAAIVGLRLTSA